jgi:hypothetical protein
MRFYFEIRDATGGENANRWEEGKIVSERAV